VESRERDQALSQIDRLRYLLRQLQRASIWPAFGEVRSRAAAFDARRYRASHCQQRSRRRQEGPGGRTSSCRKAPRQTSCSSICAPCRCASRPSTAHGCDDRAGRHQLPLLPGAYHVIGRRAARRDSRAVPGDPDAPWGRICKCSSVRFPMRSTTLRSSTI
jgi:hypothetical protein